MTVQKSIRRAHTSSILISCIINGALIFALLTLVQFADEGQSPSTEIELSPPEETEEIEEPEELEELDPIEEMEEMDFTTDFEFDNPQETEFESVEEPVEQPTESNVADISELMSDVSSPVTMSNVMYGRTAAGRAALMNRYGGGGAKYTEASVKKALEWLARVQVKEGNDRGAWLHRGESGKANAGMTGLALLTFLAHGETPSSADYGETVATAIRFLIENQDAEGLFQPTGQHRGYGHSMAVYALAEAFTMTENPLLQEPLEKGIQVMIDGMQDNGGYDYNYKTKGRSDNSLNAWHVQAMKASVIAGVGGEALRSAMQKAMDGIMLGSHENDDGLYFSYTAKRSGLHRVVTAACALCLQLTGRGETDEGKDSIDYIQNVFMDDDSLPEWDRESSGAYGGEVNLWYYAIQALFHNEPEGNAFKKYMNDMSKALIANQEEDGRWTGFGKATKHGPVYNTTLAALAMMVYYRHLPTTQADNIQRGGEEEQAPEDDADVEFRISMY